MKIEATGDEESGIVTNLPQSYLDEIEDWVLGRVPQEKIDADLAMARNARIMAKAGSINIPTLGQKIATIPRRLYHRMLHDMGQGDASSDEWLLDCLADDPRLCAPGFSPKRKGDLRHGITFVNGEAIGKGPQVLDRKLTA